MTRSRMQAPYLYHGRDLSGPARWPGGQRVPGPLLFAWYAHPPNQLGYCGPADRHAFSEATFDGGDVNALAHMAVEFDGALPYLRLIAGCNGIDDFLAYKVVEAYWVGNDLLNRVNRQAMIAMARERLSVLAGSRVHMLLAAAMRGVVHHSFHVLAVYPWIGLLRSGIREPSVKVMDSCRISWGRVVALQGDTALVSRRPLSFDGNHLLLGEAQLFSARFSTTRALLFDRLLEGDTVSLHWGWVCDRLEPPALAWLKRCTEMNLRAVNAIPAPDHLVGS